MNLKAEINFLGITINRVFEDAIKNLKGECHFIDCSVAMGRNSSVGRRQRTIEFKVVFTCDGEYMESFPLYKY